MSVRDEVVKRLNSRVRLHQTGAKHVHHPVVGDLSLTFEMLELRADAGCWTATPDQAEPARLSEEA